MKIFYFIVYRLKGSDGGWFRYYRRKYSSDVAYRKFCKLVSLNSPFQFALQPCW